MNIGDTHVGVIHVCKNHMSRKMRIHASNGFVLSFLATIIEYFKNVCTQLFCTQLPQIHVTYGVTNKIEFSTQKLRVHFLYMYQPLLTTQSPRQRYTIGLLLNDKALSGNPLLWSVDFWLCFLLHFCLAKGGSARLHWYICLFSQQTWHTCTCTCRVSLASYRRALAVTTISVLYTKWWFELRTCYPTRIKMLNKPLVMHTLVLKSLIIYIFLISDSPDLHSTPLNQ